MQKEFILQFAIVQEFNFAVEGISNFPQNLISWLSNYINNFAVIYLFIYLYQLCRKVTLQYSLQLNIEIQSFRVKENNSFAEF